MACGLARRTGSGHSGLGVRIGAGNGEAGAGVDRGCPRSGDLPAGLFEVPPGGTRDRRGAIALAMGKHDDRDADFARRRDHTGRVRHRLELPDEVSRTGWRASSGRSCAGGGRAWAARERRRGGPASCGTSRCRARPEDLRRRVRHVSRCERARNRARAEPDPIDQGPARPLRQRDWPAAQAGPPHADRDVERQPDDGADHRSLPLHLGSHQ